MYKVLIFLPLVMETVIEAADNGRYRPEYHQGAYYVHTHDGKYVHVGDGFRGYYIPSSGDISNQNKEKNESEGQEYPSEENPNLSNVGSANKYLPDESYASEDSSTVSATNSNFPKQEEDDPRTRDIAGETFSNSKMVGEEQNTKQYTDAEAVSSPGFYEYTCPDGVLYHVDYSSGKGGIISKGDHVPPVPESVQRLLASLNANQKELHDNLLCYFLIIKA